MAKKTGKYIKCPTCKRKFYVQKYALNKRKFCSKKCVRMTKEQIEKMRQRLLSEWETTRKNQKTRNYPHQIKILKERMLGEKNPQWKGDNVRKGTIHTWVKKRLPKPDLCPHCKEKPPYDLANLNNHVYRKKLEDYLWLCRKCHMKLDNRKPPIYRG